MLSVIILLDNCVRATASVLNMWPCKLKFNEEKSKHASFAQQNGLDSICAQFAEVGEGHNKAYHLSEKSLVNMIPYFWLADHNDWSRWFASLPYICSPSFMGGVEKR
jgi:hypothetical protein